MQWAQSRGASQQCLSHYKIYYFMIISSFWGVLMNTTSFNSHSAPIFNFIIFLLVSDTKRRDLNSGHLSLNSVLFPLCLLSLKGQKELILFLALWREAGENSVPGSRKPPVTLCRGKKTNSQPCAAPAQLR